MALFKISKGKESNLPKNTTEGFAYFTTDEGNFFIDIETNSFTSHEKAVAAGARIQVNANNANFADEAAIASYLKGSYDGQDNIEFDLESILNGMAYGKGNTGDHLITTSTGETAWTSYLVKGTQTAATNVWTGNLPNGITSYYEGLTIEYYLPYAGTSTAATLKLGNLTAYPVRRRGNSSVTTHFPAGSIIRLMYTTSSLINSGKGAWEVVGDNYDDGNIAVRIYRQTTGYDALTYPLLVSRTPITGTIGTVGTNNSYSSVYAVMNNDTTKTPVLNPYTGQMKVPGGIESLVTNAVADQNGNDIDTTYFADWGFTPNGTSCIIIPKDGNGNSLDDKKLSLPIASNTTAGLITTGAQTLTGAKTIDSSGSLTVSATSGFTYSGIETAGADSYRCVWFSHSSKVGTPVYNTNFQYNPSTKTLKVENVAGNASSADSLAVARTIALSTGAIGTATAFDGSQNITIPVTSIKEAYITWGGKSFSGTFAPFDACLEGNLGANRFAGVPATNVTVEYTRDGGSTWTDYGATDLQKRNFFTNLTSGTNFTIGKNSTAGAATTDYQLRVTLSSTKIYTYLSKMIMYVSTNGSKGCTVTIEGMKNGATDWTTIKDSVAISGWSGYNVINDISFCMSSNSAHTSFYNQIRFIFKTTSADSGSYNGLCIYGIKAYGGVGWSSPSTLAQTGLIYSYNGDLDVTFPSKVTASSGGFVGNLTGTATHAQMDQTGNVIDNIYFADWTATSSESVYKITPKSGKGNSLTGKALTIPNASTTVAGLITANAQTLTGAKVIDAKGSLEIKGSFNYSGIGSMTTEDTEYRPVWFSYSSGKIGTPVYNTKFKYNPKTNALSATLFEGNASTADMVNHSLTIGGQVYNGSADVTITAGDLGLSSALRFIGTTTTALEDGNTSAEVVISGKKVTAQVGDVVLLSNESDTYKEFVWVGSWWEELGDADSYHKYADDLISSLKSSLNYSDSPSGYVSSVSQKDGKIAVNYADFIQPIITITNSSYTPSITVETDGGESASKTFPIASGTIAGVINCNNQSLKGTKTFLTGIKTAGAQVYDSNANVYLDITDNTISPVGPTDSDNISLYLNTKEKAHVEISNGQIVADNTSKSVTMYSQTIVETETDSANSTDEQASTVIKGGLTVEKQISAKTVRIDNNQTSKGCTMKFDETQNCVSFVFD